MFNLPQRHLLALIFSIKKVSSVCFDRLVVEKIDDCFADILYFSKKCWLVAPTSPSIFPLTLMMRKYRKKNYNRKLHIELCHQHQKQNFTKFLIRDHKKILVYYSRKRFGSIMKLFENFYFDPFRRFAKMRFTDRWFEAKYTFEHFQACWIDILNDPEFEITMFCPINTFVKLFYQRMEETKRNFDKRENTINEDMKNFDFCRIGFNLVDYVCPVCKLKSPSITLPLVKT